MAEPEANQLKTDISTESICLCQLTWEYCSQNSQHPSFSRSATSNQMCAYSFSTGNTMFLSRVLKVGSGFFDTYLDPSGGVAPSSSLAGFHSDWFTRIDEDRTWHLTADHAARDSNLKQFKSDPEREMKAFHNLLCAIFNREYSVDDLTVLLLMTVQADYYRAVPIVSNSIIATICRYPNLVAMDPITTLIAAYKLRNKVLFKDSLIRSLGPWLNPEYKKLEHSAPALYQIADTLYTRKSVELSTFWYALLQISAETESGAGLEAVFAFHEAARRRFDTYYSSSTMLPKVFNDAVGVLDKLVGDEAAERLQRCIMPFLKNDLALDMEANPGEGVYGDYFLCFDNRDEDFPWDLTQEVW